MLIKHFVAHPNTKLFITHGGLLSTIETIYFAVPIIAIPVFADQRGNAKRAECSGFGVTISFNAINEELLSEKINEILTNPK